MRIRFCGPDEKITKGSPYVDIDIDELALTSTVRDLRNFLNEHSNQLSGKLSQGVALEFANRDVFTELRFNITVTNNTFLKNCVNLQLISADDSYEGAVIYFRVAPLQEYDHADFHPMEGRQPIVTGERTSPSTSPHASTGSASAVGRAGSGLYAVPQAPTAYTSLMPTQDEGGKRGLLSRLCCCGPPKP